MGALDQAVAFVQDGHPEKLCTDLGAPPTSCEGFLRNAGDGSEPASPPTIMASQPIPDDKDPGWLLTVCGTDGLGRRYATGFSVYRSGDGGFIANYPVYWSNVPVAILHGGESPTAAAGGPPPDCPA